MHTIIYSAIIVLTIATFSWLLYYVAILDVHSSHIHVVLDTQMAILSLMLVGAILVVRRGHNAGWQYPVHIPFLFLSLIYIGKAYYGLTAHSPPSIDSVVHSGDIITTLLFILFLVIALNMHEGSRLYTLFKWRYFRASMLLGGVLIVFLFSYSILPLLTVVELLAVDLIGILGIVGGSFLLVRKATGSAALLEDVPMGFCASTIAVFALSSIPLILSVYHFSSFWVVSIHLQLFGLALLFTVLTFFILKGYGASKRLSFAYVIALMALTILPFFTTMLLEIVTFGLTVLDLNLYAVSKYMGLFIAVQMIILILAFSKREPDPIHTPLVLIFLNWAIIDINTVIFELPALESDLNITLIGDIIGSVLTAIFFMLAIAWTLKKPDLKYAPTISRIVGAAIFALLMVLVINATAVQTIQDLFSNIEKNAILLVLNIFVILLFSYIFFLRSRISIAELRIEIISIMVLSVWIVPNILISVYGIWTVGWWVAHLIRVVGLSLGPLLIGIAYLQWMFAAEQARKRATVFSDLLVHDIRNYHQQAITTIDILELDDATTRPIKKHLSVIREALHRAGSLINNVERILRIGYESTVNLIRYDVVKHIKDSFALICKGDAKSMRLVIDYEEGTYYVLADHFINDIFTNLLLNAIQHSPENETIEVKITSEDDSKHRYWVVSISDHGSGIPPEKRAHLFSRYMDGARGTGLGLSVVKSLVERYGGSITMRDRIPGDYSKGAVFEIRFHKA